MSPSRCWICLLQVHQFEAAARGPRRDVEPHQRAETHAVRVLQVGEIEDDPFGFPGSAGSLEAESTFGDSRDQTAVTAQHVNVASAAFHVDGKNRNSALRRASKKPPKRGQECEGPKAGMGIVAYPLSVPCAICLPRRRS